MKKTFILVSLAAFGVLSFVFGPLLTNGTTAPVTTIPDTTITINTSNTGFSYTDLNDLIDQIYAEVRAEIYDDIYAELSQMISEDLYEEIYAAVLTQFDDLVASGTIPVVLNQFQDSIDAVVALANQSVFGVSTYLGTVGQSLGSGVVYRFDATTNTYFLITNQHVVDEGDNFKIIFSDESEVTATLLGVDTEADIAILSFSGVGLTQTILVSPLAADEATVKGDVVLAVGNPRGYNFYGSVTMGIVSGINRNVDYDPFVMYIQHDASINSGNSGGPLYNLEGEVVGINVSKYVSDDIEGMGFAIPIALVKRIIERVEANTIPQSTIKARLQISWLDVSTLVDQNNDVAVARLEVNPLTTLTNIKIKLPTGIQNGLLVETMEVAGTMSNSGVAVGDLIVRIGNDTIVDSASFYQLLYANYEAGDSIVVWYYQFNVSGLNYNPTLRSTTVTLK
jgi:serine protease Do